jgi:hypothetical protein
VGLDNFEEIPIPLQNRYVQQVFSNSNQASMYTDHIKCAYTAAKWAAILLERNMFPINVEFNDIMVEYSHLGKLMANSNIGRVTEQTSLSTSASLVGNQSASDPIRLRDNRISKRRKVQACSAENYERYQQEEHNRKQNISEVPSHAFDFVEIKDYEFSGDDEMKASLVVVESKQEATPCLCETYCVNTVVNNNVFCFRNSN